MSATSIQEEEWTRCLPDSVLSFSTHIFGNIYQQLHNTTTHQGTKLFTMLKVNEGLPKMVVNNHGVQPILKVPSDEELFDLLVADEDDIGILLDISNGFLDRHLLVDNRHFKGSPEYAEAVLRRATRLSNGGRGDDKLRWGSEVIRMYTQPTESSPKSVCCIIADVPITTGMKCECGERDYKCYEHKKNFRIIFIFDSTLAQRTGFKCKNRHCEEVTDKALDEHDRRAWDQAEKKGNEWNWPKDDMDIEWLWFRVSRAFTSAADNRFTRDNEASKVQDTSDQLHF